MLHEPKDVGIHPVTGIPTQNKFLEITPSYCLKNRIYYLQLSLIHPNLIGHTFGLEQESCQISESLYFRLVAIKICQDPSSFIEAIQR